MDDRPSPRARWGTGPGRGRASEGGIMRRASLAAVVLAATAGAASAQGLEFKPIDTSALVVQPTDAATNIFSRTARYLSRVVAGTIDDNGYVKTLNNLVGVKPQPKKT